MKKVKKTALVLAASLLVTTAAFSDGADEAAGAAEASGVAEISDAKKSIFGRIAAGFAESARNINKANKENIAAVKAESRANFEKATTPSPALVKFREAKGFGGKIKAMAEGIVEGTRENTEKEKARRAEIQSHESYRAILEKQRENRQDAMSR